jgi:hypothetical protein
LSAVSCSHKDLAKDAAPHFRKAKKFYDGLTAEMVQHGNICDIFSCALDNVSRLLTMAQPKHRSTAATANECSVHKTALWSLQQCLLALALCGMKGFTERQR